MTVFNLYRQAQQKAWHKEIDWADDAVVITQHTSAYAPDLDGDAYVSDLAGEVATGNGYVQGGVLLAARTASYIPANAWPQQWQPMAPYQYGQIVRPTAGNGLLFRCVTAGTTGASQPSWPGSGMIAVADGSAAWLGIAAGAISLAASSVQWLSYTGTFRYLVISDRTQGAASAQPLIALSDLGASSTGSGGNLDVNFDPSGVVALWASA